jgi:Inner membrane protein YgaP-like, transmembrane domain
MTYQDTKLSKVENVGPLDRVNRMIVAGTLIAVAVLFPAIAPGAAFSIVALSIYAGLTAATGWDPLFVIVKAFSQRAQGQSPATPITYAGHKEQPVFAGYKKAA